VALSITFVHQVGAAILLVTLTLWLQHAGFTALMAWVRHTAATDIHKLGSFRSAGLVIKSALVILTLHGAADPVVGELVSLALLPVMGIRLVLLGSQFSSVGYGDVVLSLEWRLLGPLESLVGMIMAGVSVSVLFAIVTRLLDSGERSSVAKPT
jgi:hypothetical protein